MVLIIIVLVSFAVDQVFFFSKTVSYRFRSLQLWVNVECLLTDNQQAFSVT
jgi:hypothetical protein